LERRNVRVLVPRADILRVRQILAEFFFRDSANQAIQKLVETNFNLRNLTILARGLHVKDRTQGLVDSDDYLLVWKEFIDLCGSKWASSHGPTVVFVPEVGCVFFAGWLVTALREGLNRAAFDHNIGVVGAILATIGIPRRRAKAYEESLKEGRFLVIVRGTKEEIDLASAILAPMGATGLEISDHRFVA